ncbi:GCN5-related N-acetyltransferase [Patulibacter medicamentivorans]|uniref:GCN5-related N-acetyltransferase n=1 Tax=Patulibacter medicamentivorans TaxID=1097667 RepID=H0E3I7_9ACTN|nr:GNAT family N-acetyltransferase [Patulibacter medicamentivorans]EHN11738.1 GCN5-related N-acetyltransferase [Patulibacter medicamentivorans]
MAADSRSPVAPGPRLAGPADVAVVTALVESAYRGDASRAGWTTEADLLDGQRTDRDEVAELIGADGSAIVLLEDERGLLACCNVEHRGTVGYVGMVAVRPGEQGRGTGRRLLAAAERHLRERWRLDVAEMTVLRQRPELIAWYERRGYARTGELRPFPYGDERYGIPRRPDLVLAVLRKRLDGSPIGEGGADGADRASSVS